DDGRPRRWRVLRYQAIPPSMSSRSLDAFTARIERGIREGDMKPETNPRALARFLGAIIQGMSVQARDGASMEELLDIA
ncbi:hypothetical protein ACC704_38215, partial [Rhizobium johnstonii]